MLADPVRRRRAVPALAAVLALVGALALVGVAIGSLGGDGAGRGSAAPSPADTGTPLEALDTTALAAAREPFCEAVPAAAVLRALDLPTDESSEAGVEEGAEVDAGVEASSWENGQVVRLEPGLRDVAHEHGCSWQAPSGVRARAWVFVPPTTPAEARALRASTAAADGCTPEVDAATYGRFSAAVDCTDGPGRERVLAGLLGDAWLTCTLSAPRSGDRAGTREELAGRASTWCAAVASAAGSTGASPAG